ncbi:MAG: uracil phosphoribosyltransferase [Puniceicoccaceae bacterium]
MKPVTCIDHPLAADLLTRLRDRATGQAEFRSLCDRISLALALEASAALHTEPRRIETPLEQAEGLAIETAVAVVPILRAGLGMLSSFLQLLPQASVGTIGLERDEVTARASAYYCKLPRLAGSFVFLIDPMLATGGSACRALDLLAGSHAARILLVSVLAAPEGIDEVHRRHPRVPVITASIDRELDANRYIRPGLGDFGDRLFGT